jgi:3-deoxy-manno-octulosonate cytidylyltransferase (CMP-KDO synthetase)
MNTAILIPARYGSTRYPGKPLALLNGVPMIQRVFNACINTGVDTYVLTDDRRVSELIPDKYVHIDLEDYNNGTERCAGAVQSRRFDEYDSFVNVQGDMPDVTPEIIRKTIYGLQCSPVTTVYTSMTKNQLMDPNSVKLVRAADRCLWFARGLTGYGDWHLGVYGYTKTAIKSYLHLNIYKEEQIEKLEQLRWLKNGWQIGCYHVNFNGIEINTPEDMEKWNEIRQNLG